MKPACRRSSFTLIELLVVMGIIAILASITLGAAKYVNQKAARSRAQGEIAAMEAALERYKVDNGIYPTSTSIVGSGTNYPQVPTANNYIVAATVLYTNLAGKQHYTDVATGPTYMEFKLNQVSTNNANAPYAKDPFGQPYGYTCDDPTQLANGTTNVLFNVGFFDLWSTGGQMGTGSSTNTGQWITNWQGN